MAKMNKRAKYNRVSVFDVVLCLIMVAFMACIIFPFLHVIAVSFSSNKYVISNSVSFWPKGFTVDTYLQMLRTGNFVRAYGVTIFVTVVGTVLSLTVTAMCAYALSRRAIVGHTTFSLLITFTMFFGGGMVPNYLNVARFGLTNTIWAMIIPVLINTWNMIIMRSFFVAYPKEIIESGQIDGLQDAGVFFRLVLPTSKAALATIGLYYAVAYWNNYMNAKLYIPSREELRPVQYLLQEVVSGSGGDQTEETTMLAVSVRYAAIMIVITPIMCVYPFIQKYFVKGVMVGSVKG